MAEIVRLSDVDDKTLLEMNVLLIQLSGKETTRQNLETALASPETEVWVARESGTIVGTATLILVAKISGPSARIENVVVDENQRGKGIGRRLCEKIIERAKARGAQSVHLTSRPTREAANKLYQKLGFKKRETNAYQFKL